MAWTKVKTAVVVGVAAILTVGTTTIVAYRDPAVIYSVVFPRIRDLSSDEDARYAAYTGSTPEQAARTFFEACSQENWTVVAKFQIHPLSEDTKECFGGLQLLSLGKPYFARIRFGRRVNGVFMPYEIRYKNGKVQKFRIMFRCDNADKHWYINSGGP
jgi:hypothetical protein